MDGLRRSPGEYSQYRISHHGNWGLRHTRWRRLSNSGLYRSLASPHTWGLMLSRQRRPHRVNHSEFSLRSFAKVNLTLRVLGNRRDNYHEVSTLLQIISLHDDLTFISRTDSQIRLTCSDPGIPVDERNLIVRAARVLQETAAVTFGAEIHLLKRIPAQGGLGGASANAAVALLGLMQLWQLEIRVANLSLLGKGLGADVPFFFYGGCCFWTGT